MAVFMTGGGGAELVNFAQYIQSSGTQYLDADFVPNQNTRVVLDIDITSTEVQWVFGARASTSSAQFGVAIMGAAKARYNYGSQTADFAMSAATGRLVIDANKNVCAYGDGKYTHSAAEFSSATSLFLLSMSTAGTSVTNRTSARLYSCQIYDNDVIVRDLRPCYDPDGIVCMYDRVSKRYFYNAGTGAFTAG